MPERLCVTIIILFILFPALSKLLWAQEENLGEIFVTATRTPHSSLLAPADVTILTPERWDERPSLTVDDALNIVPGLFNRRSSLTDTQTSVTLGGIPGQNRTLILLDGVPMNNAYTGDVNWAALPLESLERIEVASGPFSSLYGGYAMGGVVGLVSKRPEKRRIQVKTGYGTSWQRGEAMDDLTRYLVSYEDRLDNRFGVLMSYTYKATNGYPKDLNVQSSRPPAGITGAVPTTDPQGNGRYLIGDRGDNTWWDDSIRAKFVYDISPLTHVTVGYTRLRYRYNYDDPHTYLRDATGQPLFAYGSVRESTFAGGRGYNETGMYLFSADKEMGTTQAKLTVGVQDAGENWYTLPATSSPYATLSGKTGNLPIHPIPVSSRTYRLLFPSSPATWSPSGILVTNRASTEEYSLLYYKNEETKTTLTYNAGGKTRDYALFLQDEIDLGYHLTAYVGMRYDYWETFDGYAYQYGTGAFSDSYPSRSSSSVSPKLALVFNPLKETVLKGSVGRAFRPPTVYELYRTWTTTGTPRITYKGNPRLDPEETTSWDVGITQGLWRNARLKVSYFENYLSHLIYRATGTEVAGVRTDEYMNAGKATSKGITTELEQSLGKVARIFANFTYTEARLKENDAKPSTVGQRLVQLPEKMGNMGIEGHFGPLSATLTGRYVGKRFGTDDNRDQVNHVPGSYDPFFTWDAEITYRFHKNLSFSWAVLNMANEQYYASYKAPGRSWFIQLAMEY